ncbi:MAG: hypothetical protein IKI24_05790 [Clostridia bacterium]|nr:hypothetical protein [Clostridia bacterium]MCR4578702.1 hypothetical protein [Clostridiales bacterium]
MKTKLSALLLACFMAIGACAEGAVYTATETDQSAVDVSGTENVVIAGAAIMKTDGGASSADAASFTGVNAAVRVYDQATLTISDSVIESSAGNATGVFAYAGGTINITNCTVNVTGGGAGGVQVAGGGTLTGSDLTVTSAGKAAIRSDRGGGLMILDGGTYTSTGTNGCPAIYSTADITVLNAICVSERSRAVIIEGKNSVKLENVTLEGNDQSTKSGSIHANVLLYQSASGDAKEGTGVFTMTGGEITSNSGAMFYCTNTSGVINLSNVKLNCRADDTLLIVSAGRWGREGRNGGRCELNAEEQELYGKITVDSISELTVKLTASSFTGSINEAGESGAVRLAMDGNSSWTLTADSYLDHFDGDLKNVDANGYHLFVDGSEVL